MLKKGLWHQSQGRRKGKVVFLLVVMKKFIYVQMVCEMYKSTVKRACQYEIIDVQTEIW